MFDFQAYVAKQKPNADRAPIVQSYAYRDDMMRLRQLNEVPLLPQAVQKAMQAWSLTERLRLRRIAKTPDSAASYARLWTETCQTFGEPTWKLSIIPDQKTFFEAYGQGTELFCGISPKGCQLPGPAIRFAMGRAIGAIANQHVPYLTLARFANRLTRGMYAIATEFVDAILHWQRYALITQDRAGLLASRDISAALFVIMASELDCPDDEIMIEIQRYHAKQDVDFGENDVKTRIQALECFAQSDLYAQACHMPTTDTLTMSEVDQRVAELLRW